MVLIVLLSVFADWSNKGRVLLQGIWRSSWETCTDLPIPFTSLIPTCISNTLKSIWWDCSICLQVYKELNLDAAKKFLSAYESWWWNYRQMLLEDPQVPMIRCNWLEVVDAVEVGRLATFADNRRHLLVAYIFFGLFYSPFLPSKEEKRPTHVFKVVD